MPATLEAPRRRAKPRARFVQIRPFDGDLRLPAKIVPERAGGYSCSVPQIPGCFSCGDTLREARSMITEAAEALLLDLVGTPTGIHIDSFPLPDGRTVRRRDRRPINVWLEDDAEDGFFSARSRIYGVDAFASTPAELDEIVREQLALNWAEYAEAPDATLTREARELKRRLLASLEAVDA